MIDTEKQNKHEKTHTFMHNFMDTVADIGDALLMDYIDKNEIPNKPGDSLTINVEDIPELQSITRHFYHGDVRLFSLYMGKQGIIYFKPKWKPNVNK